MAKEKITLTKPIKINGEEKTEFEFDFDVLDTNHMDMAEAEATPADRPSLLPIAYARALGFMAIIEANPGVTMEDLRRMSVKDATALASKASAFFGE